MHLQPPYRSLVRRIFLFALLGIVALTAPQSHAGLIHQYQLNGSFGDDFGGPDLNPAGGTLGANSYSFGLNEGLSLSNGLSDPANYSIELVFNFITLSGYQKILDFKNRTTDDGLYTLGTALNFFPLTTGPVNAFSTGVDARVVITRNGTNDVFVGYVNGNQHISFTDSLDRAVFTGPNNIIHFFKDEFVTNFREASAGTVDLIRIYDTPLSAREVASLSDPVSAVPEPSTFLLLATAAGILGYGWLRQQRTVAMQESMTNVSASERS